MHKTLEQFIARARRLYEQELRAAVAAARLGAYVRRWIRWVHTGLGTGLGRQQVDPYSGAGLPSIIGWLMALVLGGVIAILLDGPSESWPINASLEMLL